LFFNIERYPLEQEAWAKQESTAWLKLAEQHGVPIRFDCATRSENTAQAIQQAAREAGAGVIALASQSGPLSASILGSVARQVVRHSESPVLVFGPRWLERVEGIG